MLEELAGSVGATVKVGFTENGPFKNLPDVPTEVAGAAVNVVLEVAPEDCVLFEEDENAPELGKAPLTNKIARRATEAKIIFFCVEKKLK